jgi:hypothetical protein
MHDTRLHVDPFPHDALTWANVNDLRGSIVIRVNILAVVIVSGITAVVA